MKLRPAAVARFLKAPDPTVAVVLLHGGDPGLVGERAQALATAVLGAEPDPFRVTDLSAAALAEGPARLVDEARALSLTGGRRVVRVPEATDAHTPAVKLVLESPEAEALVILRAGALAAGSRLRRLCEGHDRAAVIACYADTADALAALVDEVLGGAGLKVTAEARAWLAAHLGSNRQLSRRELEKLALYKGADPAPVTVDDARACVGDTSALVLEDVVFAAAGGDHQTAQAGLVRLFQEGTAPVTVLRALGTHLLRLDRVRAAQAAGHPLEAALGALKPPVFFMRKEAFRAQVGGWSPGRLQKALALVHEAEGHCKTTGLPDRALCSRALMQIAQAGRRR